MRAAIRLLTMLCLLWCGLHIAEPAAAHDGPVVEHQAVDTNHPNPSDTTPEQGTHASHHHCPIAPDQAWADAAGAPHLVIAAPVAARTTALASLTRAPPLQPPAA